VQTVLYPLAKLDAWPDDDHRTRLVFIVRDIEPGFVEDVLSQFIDAARTPNAAAERTGPVADSAPSDPSAEKTPHNRIEV
jgi:hypothetical protein